MSDTSKLNVMSVTDLSKILSSKYSTYMTKGVPVPMFKRYTEEELDGINGDSVLNLFPTHEAFSTHIGIAHTITVSGDDHLNGNCMRCIHGNIMVMLLKEVAYQWTKLTAEQRNLLAMHINDKIPTGTLFIAGKSELMYHIDITEFVSPNNIHTEAKQIKDIIKTFVRLVYNSYPIVSETVNTTLLNNFYSKNTLAAVGIN